MIIFTDEEVREILKPKPPQPTILSPEQYAKFKKLFGDK